MSIIEAYALTVDALTNLYIVERLSTIEIGRRFGVSSETVRRRLLRHGIQRRTMSEAVSGDLNPRYKDGSRVGEKEFGYSRKGWNPWNRGKTKASDSRVAEVAESIRLAMLAHPAGFKCRETWTREDCLRHTRIVASALRARESDMYVDPVLRLGPGWETEYVDDDFTFQGEDGLWHGFIADLAHPAKRFAIEVDGGYHEARGQMVKDAERDARLQGLGWRTFRVASIEDLMALVEVLVLTDDKRIVT